MDLKYLEPKVGNGPPESVPELQACSDLDPRLVLALRSTLTGLLEEEKRKAPPAEAAKEEKKKEPEPPLFWKLCSAALLSVAALICVTLYNQLSTSAGAVRGDLGQIRNEVTSLRNDLVSKDDYNARTKGVIDSIKQAQATNNASIDTWRDLLHEQKTASAELRLQIKEMERDLQRLRERLSVLEQRETAPRSSYPAGKLGR
jgi:hypothetical protein